MIEVELGVLFVVSVFWSILYEFSREVAMGIFAHICWWIFGLYWFVAVHKNIAMVSLFFWFVGLIYMLRWYLSWMNLRKIAKTGEDELDRD